MLALDATRRINWTLVFRLAVPAALELLLFKSAAAQTIEPRPTVTRAEDLVLAFASRVPVGTDAVFRQRSSASASALVNSGVQVRIFSLSGSETRPSKVSTVGDCDVYLSVVRRLEPTADGGLRFTRLDQGWINISYSGRSTKDGRWFLVFEQLGASQEEFRIKSADAEAYFATGFLITVFDDGSVPFEKIKAEYERREGDAARLLKAVDQKDARVPCYSYHRVQVGIESSDSLLADRVACTGATHLEPVP